MVEHMSALDFIRTRPPGSAVCGRESQDLEHWEIGWLVREEDRRIAALGPHPDIEFRAGVLTIAGVDLVPVLVRVGPESTESVYETWINHRDGEQKLEILAAQPRIPVHLVGDSGHVARSLGISNQLAPFAGAAIERIGEHAWSMAAFDAAKADAYQEWPIEALWRELQQ